MNSPSLAALPPQQLTQAFQSLMARAADITMLAQALCAGRATWNPVGHKGLGELIVNGDTHYTHLQDGIPVLTDQSRASIKHVTQEFHR